MSHIYATHASHMSDTYKVVYITLSYATYMSCMRDKTCDLYVTYNMSLYAPHVGLVYSITSEKLQAETACELHFAIDIFGPPFTIKRGPYATLLSVCLSSSSIGWDR